MNQTSPTRYSSTARPPIAILGVPFDNVTKQEAVALIESMIASGQPHYLVTPNVDFLVQARRDVELRRILFEAHLVLCDGTPLVWASRVLGNALPERVAGADLVPLLIQIAAQKKYRLFLLGAAPAAAERAVTRLQQQYPELLIAGHYSPPFNHLLEMDHEEIKRRIVEAKPDLLFVSFGCPKQEKWVAMNYRSLGVPVTAGVGATIDFLAGQVKRAPVWMQRSGTEWMFRLAQEPRRLLRRYVTDLWVFGSSIFPQWWQLQARAGLNGRAVAGLLPAGVDASAAQFCRTRLPNRLDFSAVNARASLIEEITAREGHCLLEMDATTFIDSTGVGFLIRLQKRLRARGRELILLAPTKVVLRALKLMRLSDFFHLATSQEDAIQELEEANGAGIRVQSLPERDLSCLRWQGEVTAANAQSVWEYTHEYLAAATGTANKIIDLRDVRFIDSSGLGLMVRAKKVSVANGQDLTFAGMRPAVRNVVRLSRLEGFLLARTQPDTSQLTPVAG
jgi:N-acetylglucosaminyldiphosphoundecaprenol N-acetyl-beta-D-mannosaminyltransferase